MFDRLFFLRRDSEPASILCLISDGQRFLSARLDFTANSRVVEPNQSHSNLELVDYDILQQR
jgi:hypothetical protein